MIQILVKTVQLLSFRILCIKQETEIIRSYIILFHIIGSDSRELQLDRLFLLLRQSLVPFHKKGIQLS